MFRVNVLRVKSWAHTS